jgi:hypothetical protein
MQAKTTVKTDKPPTITREQLERRVELLERVNRASVINAGQFGKHAAKIGALARAVQRPRVTLADRIALVETVEYLAALAESEAKLDEKCIEWVCACPPEEWDEVDAQLSDSREAVAAH